MSFSITVATCGCFRIAPPRVPVTGVTVIRVVCAIGRLPGPGEDSL